VKLIYHDELDRFIDSLQKPARAKLLRSFILLEKYGHDLGMPHVKSLQKGMYELRIRGQQKARAFFVFHHDKVVILHGFIKKTQKIPRVEWETAKKRFRNLT
jgi:phage-related protein